MITRDNYEAYLIDYMEGTLSGNLIVEIEDFLSRNPDIKNELEDIENVSIKPEKGKMPDKWNLKKAPYFFEGNYFDHLCIAKLEGDISASELRELNQIIAETPALNGEYQLYEKTILQTDKTVSFGNKNVLKHYSIGTTSKLTYSAISIAASVILFFSIYKYNSVDNQYVGVLANQSKTEIQIALTSKTQIKEPFKNKELIIHSKTKEIKKELVAENNSAKINYTEPIELISYKTIHSIKEQNSKIILESIKVAPTKTGTDIVNAVKQDYANNQDYASVKEYVREKFKSDVLNQSPKEKITLLSIAKAAVNKFNNLTGTSIKIEGKYNDQGKIQMLALESDKFGIVLKK